MTQKLYIIILERDDGEIVEAHVPADLLQDFCADFGLSIDQVFAHCATIDLDLPTHTLH